MSEETKFQCEYCNKICKNANSLAQHQIRCSSNPNRIHSSFVAGFNTKGRQAWNTGLTKETDERVAKQAEQQRKFYETHPGTFTGKTHTETYKLMMSELAHERGLGGFNMRSKGIHYHGSKLDSTYELAVAQSLDENSIVWERPKSFTYVGFDNKQHRYVPDFYLPDYDIYLDPKNDFLINNVNPGLGYNDCDKIKLVEHQLGIRVLILDSEHLTWDKIKSKIDAEVP